MYTYSIYVLLVISIFLLYYGIFKMNFKNKKMSFYKVFILVISVYSLLISLGQIMSLENTLFYKIILFGGLLIIFGLLSIIGWKLTKVPEARGYAIAGLVTYAITAIFIVIVFILAKLRFFG